MLGTQNLPLFVASGLLLNLMPGPDTLYIVGRSVSQGRRAGVVSVLGISSGCAVHTVAAAFGLSAILAASASAFTFVRLAGAAYLVYLGVRLLLDRTMAATASAELPAQKLWAICRQGVITKVLNPKVALFFLSFLPQFVDPASRTKVVAFLFLGSVFIFNSTIYCCLVAWFAAAISRRLRQRRSSGFLLKRATGAMFVGLGLKLAISR
ncbi:MAG: LysE family translocator [Verrucomicrobiota bacterium]|jgi:threonine/homoserine/homoserine lactone efflux protein